MKRMVTFEEEQEYLAYHSYRDVIENFESGLHLLDSFDFSCYKGKAVLLCGAMVAFEKGLEVFINKMYETEKDLFLLSEVTAQYRRFTREDIKCPFVCTPHLLAKEMVLKGMRVPVRFSMYSVYIKNEYVRSAIKNMKKRHPDLGCGYAMAWGYYAYLFLSRLLESLKPRKVIMWNEFYAFHTILRGLCMEKNIPLEYMEFGCLPGTICIEPVGQQGESVLARNDKEFLKKNVTKEEVEDGIKILDYLKVNGLNRNIQPRLQMDTKMLSFYDSERKTIVYFGQNDFESGMYPYTDISKSYHSPVFKSTLKALEFLRNISIKNNWNLIYKPHPIMVAIGYEKEEITGVDVVNQVDINSLIDVSDLVITILSQVSYIALIREKPVLMLGYNQLKGKGCIYEAYSDSLIEEKIRVALDAGYTFEQKRNFHVHVAQLLKYYLYDDMLHPTMEFGNKLEGSETPYENKDI